MKGARHTHTHTFSSLSPLTHTHIHSLSPLSLSTLFLSHARSAHTRGSVRIPLIHTHLHKPPPSLPLFRYSLPPSPPALCRQFAFILLRGGTHRPREEGRGRTREGTTREHEKAGEGGPHTQAHQGRTREGGNTWAHAHLTTHTHTNRGRKGNHTGVAQPATMTRPPLLGVSCSNEDSLSTLATTAALGTRGKVCSVARVSGVS